MTEILIAAVAAAALCGIIALLLGLFLGFAGEAFKVEVDPKEEAINGCLPGNNCGGCGYAGCAGLAAAIAKGEAPVNQCPVGGDEVAAKVGEIMGVSAEEGTKMVAFVKCAGTCEVAKEKYDYSGVQDCTAAMVTPGAGPKSCAYGCMGLGSCVKACKFDAIHVIDGVAVVDKEKCVACGQCVATCPRGLIELVPYTAEHLVQCNSHDKGPDVKKKCDAGCIGCTLCTKQCENEAIVVDGFLAHIDYEKCTGCGKCAEKCPSRIITWLNHGEK